MIARDPKAPVIAPPGGIRLGGKTFREGQRIPKKYQKVQPERQQDPAGGVPFAAPNFGRSILPSIYTFGTRISTVSHVYLNPDNAMRDNIQNARFMRNDCSVMECLEARQRGVALLNWHLEPEDKDDPQQKELVSNLTEILKRTPRFTEYRRNLLEAVWYGRYAVQHLYGWATIRGERRRVISAWEPINGDKLAFRYDDGSGRHREGDLGIRIGLTYLRGDVFGGRKVEATGEYGMAYFLEDWERRFVTVHKHMIEDGWFEDPQSAGRRHGVGIRDRIYWCWLLKQETSAALMEVIERTGTGFTIYRYPHGNPAAKAEMEDLGQNQTRTNVIVMPAMPGDPSMDAFGIERIEPSTAGIETMKSVIHEFFGHQIKRYILGQTLSTEAASTGLGSGVADLHQDTGLQVIAYDAANLEETITNETLDPLKELNFPWARDIRVLFKIDTKDSESDRKLQAFRQAWDMGAKLKAGDVMDVIGASMPTEDDETLYNPQIVGAIQQMEQGGGMQPGQPGAADGQPQDQNAHDFGPLMQLVQGGGGEGDYATGGQSPSGGDSPPSPPESGVPRQYTKDASGHEHKGKGPGGGQFASIEESPSLDVKHWRSPDRSDYWDGYVPNAEEKSSYRRQLSGRASRLKSIATEMGWDCRIDGAAKTGSIYVYLSHDDYPNLQYKVRFADHGNGNADYFAAPGDRAKDILKCARLDLAERRRHVEQINKQSTAIQLANLKDTQQ